MVDLAARYKAEDDRREGNDKKDGGGDRDRSAIVVSDVLFLVQYCVRTYGGGYLRHGRNGT